MRIPAVFAVVTLALTAAACGESATAPEALDSDRLQRVGSVVGADNPVGAIVLNEGEASEPYTGTCNFSGRVTTDVTLVRTPNGNALLSCHWADFPGVNSKKAINIKNFGCTLNWQGTSQTRKSHFTYNPAGGANMACHFTD